VPQRTGQGRRRDGAGAGGAAHGNPFLLEQLLGALSAAGQISSLTGRHVVGDELPSSFLAPSAAPARADPADGPVAAGGSVFDRPFTVRAAAQLLGSGRLIAAAREGAVAAGISLEQGSELAFAHDLLRQAVYTTCPPHPGHPAS